MGKSFKRYLALHAQNLVGSAGRLARQPFATAMTVLVIAIALALPGGLRVLVTNAGVLSESWQGAADFSVYLKLGVTPERAQAVADQVAARADVESVKLIGRDEALADFRKHSGFGNALDALEQNPLPDTLVVHPASGAQSNVEAIAAAVRKLPEVELVQLDTEWVARLRAMLALARSMLDAVTVLLGLAVVLVIGNTIRLEINSRSAEIEVMKLVGGSNAFIRRPFLYLGFWYGFGGALIAALLIALTLLALQPPALALAALYRSDFHITGLSLDQAAWLLAGGAVLGWAGAGLAAARHLHAIEPR
ncbi:MAG TPA: permease-like cell division protein FtsX [Gammaproteobacteria bacterium]|nr:permease-like cell division protein FtsX [Gammaproteobacteria bacterium]